MSFLILMLQFMVTGLLTFGGGFVAITLLFNQFVVSGLITETFFYQMVTIAESTPGPIAINLATYIGFTQFGVMGGVLTSLSFVLPSFAVLWLGYPFYQRHKDQTTVLWIMKGLRAVIFGMILVTMVNMGLANVDTITTAPLPSLSLVILTLLLLPTLKNRPYILLMIGAVFGVLFF